MFSFAFEGCACSAAFHIGVARWFDERGVKPVLAAGASSGSLVAAAWTVGALDVLEDRWLALMGTARPLDLSVLRRGRWPGRMSHILRQGLEQDYGHLRMAEVPELRVAVTRLGLRGPRLQILGPDHELPVIQAILGSCFIPGPYSRPIWHQWRPIVDGAWLERAPIQALPATPGVRRIAVVSVPTGDLRAGLRGRAMLKPDDVQVVHPRSPLRATGFVFDRDAAVAGIREGRIAAERFALATGWMDDPWGSVGSVG